MMSAVNLLRNKILNDKVIVPFLDENESEKKSVALRDKKAGTVFIVSGLPTNSIVIKADVFPPLGNFFKSTKGETRRADFIIISETETKKWIVYIEIKKGDRSSSNKKIIQQLKGAQCVIAYCVSLVEKFHEKTRFLDSSSYKPRFVSVRSPHINKTPTRNPENKKEVHSTPEKMLKLRYSPKSHFNKLVYKE